MKNRYNPNDPLHPGHKNKTSKYKGVCWHNATQKWQAAIRIKKQKVNLGLYDTQSKAALAYNVAQRLAGRPGFENNIPTTTPKADISVIRQKLLNNGISVSADSQPSV